MKVNMSDLAMDLETAKKLFAEGKLKAVRRAASNSKIWNKGFHVLVEYEKYTGHTCIIKAFDCRSMTV